MRTVTCEGVGGGGGGRAVLMTFDATPVSHLPAAWGSHKSLTSLKVKIEGMEQPHMQCVRTGPSPAKC